MKDRKIPHFINSSNPTLSIIIPVYQEKDRISKTISMIKNQSYAYSSEIIIVDGSINHDTIKTISDQNIIKTTATKGRGQQLNAGAAIARGKILLFLHADSYLPENALTDIVTTVQKKQVNGGAFNLVIDSQKYRYRILGKMISLRARITKIPFGDQAYFFTKSYFNKIGGYPAIPIMEDIEMMRQIKKRGDSIYLFKKAVMTSPRRWEKEGIIRCTLRNWYIRMRYYLGADPKELERYYN